MQKYLKNNIVIVLALAISSIILTILYYMKGLVLPNFVSFAGNALIIMSTILGVVICGSIFMLATDSLFCRDKKFKERFFYITKSLWISQLLLLPVSIILILADFIFNLDVFIINKIIVFTISYVSQIILFFSYKLITKLNWNTVIKVVASQFVLTLLLNILLKFI